MMEEPDMSMGGLWGWYHPLRSRYPGSKNSWGLIKRFRHLNKYWIESPGSGITPPLRTMLMSEKNTYLSIVAKRTIKWHTLSVRGRHEEGIANCDRENDGEHSEEHGWHGWQTLLLSPEQQSRWSVEQSVVCHCPSYFISSCLVQIVHRPQRKTRPHVIPMELEPVGGWKWNCLIARVRRTPLNFLNRSNRNLCQSHKSWRSLDVRSLDAISALFYNRCRHVRFVYFWRQFDTCFDDYIETNGIDDGRVQNVIRIPNTVWLLQILSVIQCISTCQLFRVRSVRCSLSKIWS